MTSSEVNYRFWAITRNWNKIQAPKHVHRVCLVKTVDWYATRPFRVRSWPWPEVKFQIWPFEVNLYIIRRALIRQTRWCANRFYAVFRTRIIAENNFRENRLFWPYMTSEGQTVELTSKQLTLGTFRIERAVECFFPRLSSPSSFRATSEFVVWTCRNVENFDLAWPLEAKPLAWSLNGWN